MENTKMSITLEDVEIAIKVLNAFIKRQREAVSTLRRLGVTTGRGGAFGFRMEDFVSMAMQQAMAQKGVGQPSTIEPAPEPTPEELERMRAIAKKLKKRGTSPNPRRGY